ncbi:MAG: AIR synthase related protein [Planctomycetota bacterium]
MEHQTLAEIARAWAEGKTARAPAVQQVRDVTIMDIGGGMSLVMACDALGAIGSKEHDILRAPFQVVGRFTARVALFELIAAGAAPLVVVNALSVEMEPAGRQIIEGIRAELKDLGLAHVAPITGSTEENMPTTQTALGVVAVGVVATDRLKIGKGRAGDEVYCIGLPKVGEEVEIGDPEMLQAETLLELARFDFVHDMVPVGSRGVAYEARELARSAGLQARLESRCGIDLEKSAGPATCAVAALAPDAAERLGYVATEPVTWVGRLE